MTIRGARSDGVSMSGIPRRRLRVWRLDTDMRILSRWALLRRVFCASRTIRLPPVRPRVPLSIVFLSSPCMERALRPFSIVFLSPKPMSSRKDILREFLFLAVVVAAVPLVAVAVWALLQEATKRRTSRVKRLFFICFMLYFCPSAPIMGNHWQKRETRFGHKFPIIGAEGLYPNPLGWDFCFILIHKTRARGLKVSPVGKFLSHASG
jgi:hypothetical protein